MLMNQVLDTSNSLRDPDDRSRAVKRSASVASLPTPPRTHHKRSRSRARSASHHDSDGSGSVSELDDDLCSGYDERIKRSKTARNSKSMSDNDDEASEDESPERKKRRTLNVLPGHDEDEDDENVFWIGRVSRSNGGKEETKKTAEASKTEQSSPSPAMLRYRVMAPVSPPPSRRQPVIQPIRDTSERDVSSADPALPVTPRRLFLRAPSPPVAPIIKTPAKPKDTKIWPERDSPNNPFLVESDETTKIRSNWDSSDDEEEIVGEAWQQEGTPTPSYEEKPTITYVFRGQKATFQNPLYGLSPEVVAASKLPIDHPDYEAAATCPPKKLFSGKRKTRVASRTAQRLENNDETSEGEQSGVGTESQEKVSPAHQAETVLSNTVRAQQADNKESQVSRDERQRRETTAKSRLASRDGLRAGAVVTERDEPARRAMGPLRSA